MKNHFVDLIEDAHKLVNEMRKKKNLPPYPFDKIKEHEIDPFAVVREVSNDAPKTSSTKTLQAKPSMHVLREAIAKAFPSDERKEMPDHGFTKISNVECACGCKELMTYAWMNGGKGGATSPRKYQSGHAPKKEVKNPRGPYSMKGNSKNQDLNKQLKSGDAQVTSKVTDLSPKKMIEVFSAQRDQVIKERAMCTENCQRIGSLLVEEQATLRNLEVQYAKLGDVIHAIERLSCIQTAEQVINEIYPQDERGEYVAN